MNTGQREEMDTGQRGDGHRTESGERRGGHRTERGDRHRTERGDGHRTERGDEPGQREEMDKMDTGQREEMDTGQREEMDTGQWVGFTFTPVSMVIPTAETPGKATFLLLGILHYKKRRSLQIQHQSAPHLLEASAGLNSCSTYSLQQPRTQLKELRTRRTYRCNTTHK